MEQQSKYFAFISYSSKDTEWGKRLQKKLEHYRMPSTLCSERGWERTPMNPVFFAPTDIQPGGLTEELQERLKASRNLIVICSPASARSKWVGMEIEYFHKLGRTKNIHFFIVEGQPHSGDPETECFNPVVHELGLPEILGANIHEKNYKLPWLNRERAYVQLVSKLLGVEFDTIWQRHKRRIVRKIVAWTLGIIAVVAALIAAVTMSRPVDVQLQLHETSVHNDNLPPMKDAVVTLAVDNVLEVDTLRAMEDQALFKNIPHKYLNKPVRITVVCDDFMDVDTTVVLNSQLAVNIARDPKVYGDIRFRIWNRSEEKMVPGVTVAVAGQTVVSDAQGYVSLTVPLAEQRKTYPLSSSVTLHEDSLYMPCGNDYYLFVEE
ncbi:MAG: toll/interleukin-1 receptor domain-containing protein [Bacteroidales bacterium]|jgi:hypothetical protein|nr:toll/interleukin-1 receptor domain-containing protein [Bacteroidales bacterium]